MAAHFIREILTASTPWFVAAAIVSVVLWLASRCRHNQIFARPAEKFNSLTPFGKIVAILSFCLFAMVGGSKEDRGNGGNGIENEELRMEDGESGDGPRSLPPALASASNLIAILDFVPDPPNRSVVFEVACSNILFDYTASRNLYLFASTNLLDPRWMPLGAFAMPPGTNICVFAVTTNDVDSAALPWFLDSLAGIGFYRFAADIDTDGDGLIDSYETLCSFTDPELADTDGDGLADGQELSAVIGTDPLLADTDGDGIYDGAEVVTGTSPLSADTDGDGLSDGDEMLTHGTDPLLVDTDGDGLSDFAEISTIHTDPLLADTDGDGLSDGDEIVLYTNPILADTDSDGMPDGWEVWNALDPEEDDAAGDVDGDGLANIDEWRAGTNPNTPDTDGDGLTDCDELLVRQTDPLDADTDGDGFSDGDETLTHGTDPLVADTDGDGLPDGWEVRYGLDPLSATGDDGAAGDPDGDGLSNAAECAAGTNPSVLDTDGDGLSDGAEALTHGSNPLVADTDGDGIDDGEEVSLGTSPTSSDTDGDGLSDGWEVLCGLDPLSASGDDGAAGDPDGDGVANVRELALGTDPLDGDTDLDGLSDGEEAGSRSFDTSAYWLDWRLFSEFARLGWRVFDADDPPDGVRMPLPNPIVAPDATYTHFSVDTCGVFHLYTNSTDMAYAPLLPCRDLEREAVLDSALTVAPLWAPLEFGTQSVVRVYEVGAAYLNVEYERMRLQDSPDAPENEASVQAWVGLDIDGNLIVDLHYANVGSNVWNAASVGFRAPGGRTCQTFSHLGSRPLSQGVVTFDAWTGLGTDPVLVDTDGDGLSDGDEVLTHGSSPLLADTDGDGLTDAQEVTHGTGLNNPDTDGDGLLDGWEVANQLNPLFSSGGDGASGDIDNDGLTNIQEQEHGGNPRSADTDGDGLSDVQEITNGTGIANPDTDSDGLTDKQELDLGYDPLDPDMDRDGMTDGWEVSHGLDPQSATGDNGADGDPDHDGLSSIDEYLNNTNPHSADTDGDGVPDRIEVERGANPADPSDNGQPQSPESFRTLTFNIYGDYAAWEMQIEGLGPSDTRTRRISMAAPNASESVPMKMRKGSSYRISMRWLNSDGHTNPDWYCWQARIDGMPGEHTYESYSSVRRSGVAETIVGNGWIAENLGGLLTSHVHENANSGGNVAGGLTAMLYVLGDPKLIPDYDRNGRIDSTDEAVYDAGNTTFRFWINDDNDIGDIGDSRKDRPGSGLNGRDGRVNGRGDLLDFTPVLLDVSDVFPPGTSDSIKERVSWKLESSVVNAVWTSLPASSAGSFHKTDCGAAFGPNLSQDAHEAMVDRLAGGKELPGGFVSHMRDNGGKGVVMIEGRASGSSLRLQGFVDESQTPSFEGSLAIEISSVEDMYRYVTLRGAESSSNFTVQIPGIPPNLMDGGKDLDVFFTHGFNVTESDAHAWGSEIFKRLWQSGSNARFWMFTWSGDYNWISHRFNGLHYQQDVYQALKTGAALKAFVGEAQPDSSKRILMTQSLGNMVACEALRQGLCVGKYFMFNAAVASEAIDGTLQNANATVKSKYVPSDWNDYDLRSWAANWHKWFVTDTTDSRGRMGWPNYFSTVLARAGTVYNYYSTGDPVFMEEDTVPGVATGVFHWPTLNLTWPFVQWDITTEANSWQKQETHKGVEPIAGTLRGGWGFDCWYENVGGEPVQMYYTAAQANAMVVNGSITNSPVFSYGGTPLNNRNASQDDIWLSLAKYVPAVSSPVGGDRVWTTTGRDVDLNENSAIGILRPNGWGRSHNVFQDAWLHSDMKDMAFFYVHKLYEQLVSKGDL